MVCTWLLNPILTWFDDDDDNKLIIMKYNKKFYIYTIF